MTNLKSILKIEFLNYKNKLLGQSKKMLIVLGVFVLFFIYTIIIIRQLVSMCQQLGFSPNYSYVICFVIGSGYSFLHFFRISYASIFDKKGFDMLISLPIKIRDILISKFLPNYIITSSFILLFNFAVFLFITIQFGFSVSDLINVFLIALTTPLIPMVLATIFGGFLKFIVSRINLPAILDLLVTAMSFILVMSIYMIFIDESVAVNVDIFDIITNILPTASIVVASINGNFFYLTLFLVVSIIVSVLLFEVLSYKYIKLCDMVSSTKVKSKFYLKDQKEKGVLKTLILRDIKIVLTTNAYVINTLLADVLIIILMSYVAFDTFKEDITVESILQLSQNIPQSLLAMVLTGISFVFCMANSAYTSISIEGKGFWVLKSLPVRPFDIMLSKALTNVILKMPIFIIINIAITILGIVSITLLPIFIIYELLLLLTFSLIAVILNLKWHRFDFKNPVEVIKRGTASMIYVFSVLIIGVQSTVISGAVNNLLNVSPYTIYIFKSIVLIIVLIYLISFLKNKGTKIFNNITV